jgi:hypothetical protein
MPKLINHVFSVVMPPDHARKLTQIAEHKGVSVGELVNEVLAPLLAEDDDDGRWVLLRIDNYVCDAFHEFFEGDADMVAQSMGASIEIDGEAYARACRQVAGR